MEWIGTISFAASGTLVAVGCGLDPFGVITVGTITAVGGGIMRDLLIGNIPPKIFSNPLILLVAAITSVLVFTVAYFRRKKFQKFRQRVEVVNVFFDALGLAAFSITGVEIACLSAYKNNFILVITLGVITGVGGGVLRDVLVNEKPYILVRHIYAVVSILGSCLYYLLSVRLGYKVSATFVVIIFTVLMRMMAAKFRWRLPKIELDEREDGLE
jgi:uncharacterized membrane protein YeiH